jgi:ATP-binding protein involved in chromosome partitioning
VPLTMPLRAHADAGIPLVAVDPDDAAAQAIRHAAQGLIALAPAKPIALPVLDSEPAPALQVVQAGPPQPVGMSLPMAG